MLKIVPISSWIARSGKNRYYIGSGIKPFGFSLIPNSPNG